MGPEDLPKGADEAATVDMVVITVAAVMPWFVVVVVVVAMHWFVVVARFVAVLTGSMVVRHADLVWVRW